MTPSQTKILSFAKDVAMSLIRNKITHTSKVFDTLRYHKKSKHQNIMYNCDQCDYTATQRGNLNYHIQAKHEGIKYPCNQCDYELNSKSSLSYHKKAKH